MAAGALRLRRDPRALKLPPYVSLLCIIVGVAWLLMLPQNDYSRRTYISENALLPGQVHTYFGGSDQNVFRAYKHEVDALAAVPDVPAEGEGEADPAAAAAAAPKTNHEINDGLETIFKNIGLKVGRQNFTYTASGRAYAGENIYAILQAPRGDATEAIVLVAAWRNVRGELNRRGVALLLTLARYFRRWSLWSKDIILVVTPDSLAGPQAWVDAYHDAHDTRYIDSLPLKSGALQGAIALDYTQETRFASVHIVYDGINGQLPNLDLINSVVNIAGGQMGIGVSIQEMWSHNDGYEDRLRTMLRGMMKQGLGVASGPHSCFIPYHVDAITLRPYGDGWQDEMAMGRVVEGTFRSLNNLLEHLHQSFFFYLLMHKDRFVSIGTYLPSAMLIAANFTIISISLWIKSGQQDQALVKPAEKEKAKEIDKAVDKGTAVALVASASERDLSLPLALVAGCQFLGVVPFYIFNHLPEGVSTIYLPYRKNVSVDKSTDKHTATYSSLRPLRPSQRLPTPPHQRYAHHQLPSHPPTILPHAVLLPPPAGHVPLLARDTQLLPVPHGWPSLLALVLRAPLAANPGHAVGVLHCAEPRRAHGRPRGLVGLLAWRRGLGREQRGRGAAGGGVRVAGLGHVYQCRRLGRLVARLVGGCRRGAWEAGRDGEVRLDGGERYIRIYKFNDVPSGV